MTRQHISGTALFPKRKRLGLFLSTPRDPSWGSSDEHGLPLRQNPPDPSCCDDEDGCSSSESSASNLSLSESNNDSTATTDATTVRGVSDALREMALVSSQPATSGPVAEGWLIDRRFQMQPSKVAFVIDKRSERLWSQGLGLRLEARSITIQDFLDETRPARHRNALRDACAGSGGGSCPGRTADGSARFARRLVRPAPEGTCTERGNSEEGGVDGSERRGGVGDAGPASSTDGAKQSSTYGVTRRRKGDEMRAVGVFETSTDDSWAHFQDMTLVYNTSAGWIYLHRVTEDAARAVEQIEREITCEELGISPFAMMSGSLLALQGMAELFNEGPNVAVRIDGCIVRVAGTPQAVESASRAIESVARSNERSHRLNGHWFWRGDPVPGSDMFPTFPMKPETCFYLDHAYAAYLEDGQTTASYVINGARYEANFTTMTQKNVVTLRKRHIERLVPHRMELPLARCPKEALALTSFREGTTYTIVPVTKVEEALVKKAVAHTIANEVIQVQHIWNSFLWEHYAQNAKSIGNEMLLFHGASSTALSQICRTGFDRRMVGSANGAAYGRGCYFARDANYAFRFSFNAGGTQLLMAKVLVGRYTKGRSDMVRPPRISSAGDRTYDSTCNDEHAPTIYVTYKDWQAYPMYLVSLKRV